MKHKRNSIKVGIELHVKKGLSWRSNKGTSNQNRIQRFRW